VAFWPKPSAGSNGPERPCRMNWAHPALLQVGGCVSTCLVSVPSRQEQVSPSFTLAGWGVPAAAPGSRSYRVWDPLSWCS
jgi:hypothetical protein